MRIPLVFALVLWLILLAGVYGTALVFPPAWALPLTQLLMLGGAFIGARFLLPGREGTPVLRRLSWTGQPPAEVALAGVAAFLLLPGMQMIFDRMFRLFPGYAEYVASQQAVLGSDSLGLGYGFLLVTIVVLPALCEEFLFRGYLSSALRASGFGVSATVMLGGLLFGLFHLDPWRLIPVSILGMIMVWLVETGGSLLAGMAFHFVNNGIVFLGSVLAASSPNAGLDNADISLGQVFFSGTLFALGVLALVSYARRAGVRRSKAPSRASAAGQPGSGW